MLLEPGPERGTMPPMRSRIGAVASWLGLLSNGDLADEERHPKLAGIAMTRPIRFCINHAKAIEALVWLASSRPGMTPGQIAKILFFADKAHLARYARPVLGDRWVAMEHGPVPSFVYDVLKVDKGFLDADLANAVDVAIRLDEASNPRTVHARRAPDADLLSRTDIECLGDALARFGSLPFSELRRLSHADRAWAETAVNQEIDYELMVDEDVPDRDDLLDEIRTKANLTVF
jgi:uncharacterized phage-associated protein